MTPDMINGGFEFIGAAMLARNVWQLYKDKIVRGVHWWATAFFASWGYWNLFYYPSLDQWVSFAGGVALVLVNTVWLAQMLYYLNKERRGLTWAPGGVSMMSPNGVLTFAPHPGVWVRKGDNHATDV